MFNFLPENNIQAFCVAMNNMIFVNFLKENNILPLDLRYKLNNYLAHVNEFTLHYSYTNRQLWFNHHLFTISVMDNKLDRAKYIYNTFILYFFTVVIIF